jgi:hypothetical protein
VLAHLPGPVAGVAGQSITATQGIAQQLGQAGQFLLSPANTAYVDAMRLTTLIGAAVAVLGGLVVMRWMPGKPRPAVGAPTMDELAPAELAEAELADTQLADAEFAYTELAELSAAEQKLSER